MRIVIPRRVPYRSVTAAGAAVFFGWISTFGPGPAGGVEVSAMGQTREVLPRGRVPAAAHVSLSTLPSPSSPSSPRAAAPVRPLPVDCQKATCVALTFDDGPGPYTAKLLNMLAARHAKATFFLIGNLIQDRAALARREVAEGHAVGDHSWSHPPLTTLSGSEIRSELSQTRLEIHSVTGVRTSLMRPPDGDTDERVAAITRTLGLAQILWSVDTNDWRDRDSAIVAERAISWAHRNDIILMHDIHPTTVNAVPRILEGLRTRGFVFVTIPELFAGRPLKPGSVYTNG